MDTPFTVAFRQGSNALVFAGVVVGLLWMRRLMSVESEKHVLRATAPGRRRWPAYAVGAGLVLLATVLLVAELIAASTL